MPHFGEEPPLSGFNGAGTVFFSGCALHCLYCQNYQISQEGLGEEITPIELADLFLDLQGQGCHNLDLVSPTPHLPFILQALESAIPRGFRLPLVYNTHGYLSESTLALLNGIVDIYLPDLKYGEDRQGSRLSQVENYTACALKAIKTMFGQVGPLRIDEKGLAYRGLLIRHLVLPQDQSASGEVLRALASFSLRIPLSLMAQYRPCYKALQVPEINRPLRAEEYQQVVALGIRLGLDEIFIQELESAEIYSPDFASEDPFERL
jgi:putative pyruvate formate lyase activating enzyme